jgi:ABC-type lipoprotein release transport system permease subunit
MVRLISEKDVKQDKSLIKYLGIKEDQFDIDGYSKVVIGEELAKVLQVSEGNIISVISLAGNNFASLRPDTVDFVVTAIFHSGYYQFDRNMIFISDDYISLFEQEKPKKNNSAEKNKIITAGNGGYYPDNGKVIGIKLKNRYRDIETI